jgi:hypothetical protein
VDIEIRGHGGVEGVEELAELDAAMSLMQLANDGAGLRIQGREARCGAVPDVVVGPPLDLAKSGCVRSRA